MTTHVLTLVLALAVGGDTPVPTGKLMIKKDEVEYQTQMFESWWGTKLEWKLSELPTEGMVFVMRSLACCGERFLNSVFLMIFPASS